MSPTRRISTNSGNDFDRELEEELRLAEEEDPGFAGERFSDGESFDYGDGMVRPDPDEDDDDEDGEVPS